MARGNEVIVSSQPQGKFLAGFLAGAYYPGMIVQIDPTVALRSGRHTYKVYDRAADGDQPAGAFWVVREDNLQGKTINDAFASGDFAELYSPMAGEELNLRVADIAGTGDDHTAGEIMMVDDGTGMLIATTGSPETEVAILLETITDPTAAGPYWCQWTGH